MPKLRELPYRRVAEPTSSDGVRIGAAGPSLTVNGGKAGYQLHVGHAIRAGTSR